MKTMKKIKLLAIALITFIVTSCSDSGIKDVAYFNFQGADYWVWQYDEAVVSDVEILKSHANTNTNPQKTVYHFYFKNNIDINILKTEAFSLQRFAQFMVDNNPDFHCYMMPNQPMDEDAMFLMNELVKASE